MRRIKTVFIIAVTIAAGAPVAHGGDFNACRVTYDFDGTLLVNGERFFPVGNYFLPQGYPEGQGIPTIDQAYAAFAASGGNILFGPRYYHMLYSEPDRYAVHFLPSDLYYGETECVNHLNAADEYGVKLVTCPHIFWWWDAEYPGGPGPHPQCMSVVSKYGWPINLPPEITQEERFSGMEPGGGIKSWVENGASSAFIGYDDWPEAAWVYWRFKWLVREPPEPPTPEPAPVNVQINYAGLRALEEDPAVDAEHATFIFHNMMVRHHDLWRSYNEGGDIVAINVGFVPEPYQLKWRDQEDDWVMHAWLPNYYIATSGDALDVLFETVGAKKPVVSIVQNHWCKFGPPENERGAEPTESQYRFMTYDSVIHRANGVLYGVESFGSMEENKWNIFETRWDLCKPVFSEIGQGGLMHEVLKGEYDNLLVDVKTERQGNEVERSTFIAGELAPKNHFLSDQVLMEGCAKKHDGFTYLVVACREGIDQFDPVSPFPYEVTFRPYFSSKTPWAGTVEVVGEEGPGGEPRTINVANGEFTDNFLPEEVHIYKFQRPSPFVPD